MTLCKQRFKECLQVQDFSRSQFMYTSNKQCLAAAESLAATSAALALQQWALDLCNVAKLNVITPDEHDSKRNRILYSGKHSSPEITHQAFSAVLASLKAMRVLF